MPELPEVETIVRQISPEIVGRKIESINVEPTGLRMLGKYSPAELQNRIGGRMLTSVSRHGKFIIFDLDDQNKILAHLRMSGRFSVSPGKIEHPHKRLAIHLNEKVLNFIDIRRFGTFHYYSKSQARSYLGLLGKDALDPNLSVAEFANNLKKRHKSIYASLLDQKIIAGVGNIYANEALFASGIHPLRPSHQLSIKEPEQLLTNIISILNNAIAFKGTTLIDKSYKDAFNTYGLFKNRLKIYGKKGIPCSICQNKISPLRITGRSVFICSNCQK